MPKRRLSKEYSRDRKDDEYRFKEELSPPPTPAEDEKYESGKTVVKEVEKKRTIPQRDMDKEMEPLKRQAPEIIGNLFDRIQFLKERIEEIQKSIDTRKGIHKNMINEINADIEDRQSIISSLGSLEDKRDFKLDISMLRKEKRQELVRFWKDLLELRTELGELKERHKVEKKIADLFKGINV